MLTGDKFTIADAYIAHFVFSYFKNPSLAGGAQYTDKGKAIIAGNAAFAKYVKTLEEEELKEYLANRQPHPF